MGSHVAQPLSPVIWLRVRPGVCTGGRRRRARRQEGDGAPFPELQANQSFFQTGQAEQNTRKIKRKEADVYGDNERSGQALCQLPEKR